MITAALPEYLQRSFISLVALATALSVSCSSFGAKKESPVADQRTQAGQLQRENPAPAGVERPRILSRQEWKAREAVGQMQPHTPRHITIHHTASPQKIGQPLEKKMQNLQNFSQSESRLASGKMKPAWPDVPYHFYIAADGQIAEGRDLHFAGDTNTDYDPRGHLLIVLEGNFENEQPSTKQLASLSALVAWLSAEYAIPPSEIKAHNDYAATACPGVNLKKALPALRHQVAESRGTIDSR